MPDVVSPERKELSELRQAAYALDIVTFNERKQEFFCRACRYRDPLGPDGNKLHDYDCPWLHFLNELEAAEAELARLRAQKIDQGIRAGRLLGPEFDGASLEDIASEVVRLRAQLAKAPEMWCIACATDHHEQCLGGRCQCAHLVPAWQPIETAPKDEKRVMLFNPDEEFGDWRFQTGAHYEQLGGWQYDGQNIRYSNAHQPTHWQPLPAPPVASPAELPASETEPEHEDGCPAITDDESDYEYLADAGECVCRVREWRKQHAHDATGEEQP